VKLRVVARDGGGDQLTDVGPISFVSQNPSIAVVDSAGVVTAIHVGSTYVAAALSNGSSTLADSVAVTVGAPVQ
jgi:uncharacterized protein YjdB